MARIQSPVIGRAKGQAGGMVFTTLNGQNIMKAKAYSYRDQNTLVQQANRAMAATTSRLAAALKAIARSLFVSQPQDMPAYSKLIQQFQSGVNRSALPYVINYTGLVIGSGSFDPEIKIDSYTPGTGATDLSWNPGSLPAGYDETANVEAIIIDSSTNSVVAVVDAETDFIDGATPIVLPTGLVAANLHVAMLCVTTKAGADLQKSVKIFS